MKLKIHEYRLKTTQMSKKCLLLFVLIITVSGFSQSVNDYQYVIVPTKFSIFKEGDKYRLNSTTKLLLEKYGLKVFMSNDEVPGEIGDNCKRLYADLVEDKELMSTKIKLVLKDCKEKVIYETDYGKSREKDYATAYNQALRETTKSFDRLNYIYNGKNATTSTPSAIPETKIDISEAVEIKAENASITSNPPIFYFAQPTTNGFQVIDNEPKVIMRLLYSSQKNVFIGIKGSINGVVITKNGQWFFEYYDNGKLISESLNIKF
jgi:hypothetical protein